MKNILLIIIFSQALALFADDRNYINSTSVETNGYLFIVSTTNTYPKIGDMVAVKATLRNISTNALAIALSSPLRDNKVQVLWRKNQSLDLTLYGRHSQNDDISWLNENLEPGQQVTESFQINRLFDMSNSGDYEIIISHRIRIHNNTDWGTIDAPPLKITLKER